MSFFRTFLLAAGLSATAGAAAIAGCASDEAIETFVADYLAKVPTAALVPDGTMDDAQCTQEKLVDTLREHLGPVIGYKAGLTSKPAQERFGVTQPVGGVLYRDMMVEDGAEVPAKFGAIPLFEADLILVVGDDAIMGATTPEEVMAHVSAVRPFIELPDLTLKQGEPINGVTLTAIGVAPRMGVLGAEIPVGDPAEMLAALGAMQVTVRDAAGNEMASAPGSSVLGNPANSVLWLMSAGYLLTAGDLISIGSIGPLLPPAKAGGGASVTYVGLPGDPKVSVVFTE